MGVHGYCLPSHAILDNEEQVSTESLLLAEPIAADSDSPSLKCGIFNSNRGLDLYEVDVNEGYVKGESVRDRGNQGSRGKDKVDFREKSMVIAGSDLPGFIPLREDFDVEPENDAELMLADMEFRCAC